MFFLEMDDLRAPTIGFFLPHNDSHYFRWLAVPRIQRVWSIFFFAMGAIIVPVLKAEGCHEFSSHTKLELAIW